MSSRAEVAAVLLEQLARLLRELSANDEEKVLDGRMTLSLSAKAAARRRTTRANSAGKKDLSGVAETLRAATSRDEAVRILREESLKTAELRELARELGVAASKDDKLKRLEEKVIEGSVGFRLRSDAIRGAR